MDTGISLGLPPEAKKVFEGEIFSVWQWPQQLYDGSTKTFERIERPDTVFVLPVLPDGKILMIMDEQPAREAILTLPAGRMDVAGENPDIAARRELLEETGYEAGQLIPWYTYRPSGKILWTIHCFIARDLQQTQSPDPGPGEKITLIPKSFDDFMTTIRQTPEFDPALRARVFEALLDESKMKELKTLLYD